ncbi:MAG: hypothetical protein WBL44_17815 [Nitrososphaeraceae archaeon]|jgi:hypothetical protein
MIVIPIIAVVIGLIVVSSSIYSLEIDQYGVLGSAHEHSAFEIKLNGTALDFSKPEFQVQSKLIHVEGGDGYTLHRHADKVPFGEFLRSVNMGMEGECFLVNNGAEGGEQKYCNDNDDKLRVFVNGKEFANPQPIVDYIFEDNDRILVIIGNETSSEIKNELDTLNQIPIQRIQN